MPSISVPQAVWDLAQQISGRKNPASFLRNNVLIPWALTATNIPERLDPVAVQAGTGPYASHNEFGSAAPIDLNPTPEISDDLLRRKTRLNCVDNSFDQNFTTAWVWACNQWGGERRLVEFLEDQTSLRIRPMTNPRGVVIARWRDATTPVVPG